MIMKTKNIFTFLFAVFMTIAAIGQDPGKKNKLKFNSFSVTLERFFVENTEGGGARSFDASLSINENIFGVSATSAFSKKPKWTSETFEQTNFLYGREFKLSTDWFIGAFTGIGIFEREWKQTEFSSYGWLGFSVDNKREFESTKGIPIVLKLRGVFKRKFSIGLKLQANLNTVANMGSAGLLLQWNYN